MRISRTSFASILIILILSTMVLCVSSKKPEDMLATTGVVLNALNLPYSQSPEDNGSQQQNLSVLFIENSEGRLLAAATWDGSPPRVSLGGKEWVYGLSALLEGRHVEYELGINIENKEKLPGGSVVLTIKDVSGFELGSSYTHILRLRGFECLVSDDGRFASLSSDEAQSNGLSSFIAMVAQMGSCNFRFEQAEDLEEEPCLIIATSERKEGKQTDDQVLMAILLVSAQSWAPEHVLSFAHAMEGAERVPDIRVLGISDKTAVSPGQKVRYSYFIFNAGMENAVDVELTIQIPAKVELLPNTLSGSKGELILIQQGQNAQAPAPNEEGTGACNEEKTMRILLTEEIFPGETISIEFEVAV